MNLPDKNELGSNEAEPKFKGMYTLLWIVVPTLAGSLLGAAFFNATAGAALFGLPALALSLLIRRLVTRTADDRLSGLVSR